jgi:hypothetical protein
MFSIARFSEQFMILFRQNKNRHGLIFAIFIIFQLIGYANYFASNGGRDLENFYKFATFLTFIMSIMACQDVFNKLRNTASGIQYFMTPATILEKYLAAWLYSSLFAFVTTQLTYFVVHFIGINVGNAITGMSSELGFPVWQDILKVFLSVMFVHSVFFFGSLLFRKNPIIKTMGSYIAIMFLFTVTFAWYAKHYLLSTQLIDSNNMNINFNGSLGSSINGMPFQHFLEMIGLNIKWILSVIALLLWSGSYILLTKKQI